MQFSAALDLSTAWRRLSHSRALNRAPDKLPESNGKRNWTAMFARTESFDGLVGSSGGITIAGVNVGIALLLKQSRPNFSLVSQEQDTEPFILDYGDDIQTPEEWAGEKGIERYKRNKPAPEAASKEYPLDVTLLNSDDCTTLMSKGHQKHSRVY